MVVEVVNVDMTHGIVGIYYTSVCVCTCMCICVYVYVYVYVYSCKKSFAKNTLPKVARESSNCVKR